jgi:hypothetical protein
MDPPTAQQVLDHMHGFQRTLKFSDFRLINVPPSQASKALTSAQYTSTFASAHLTDRQTYSLEPITVTVQFNKSASWMDRSSQVASLLDHEQGHFDIVRLIARDLCRQLISLEIDAIILDSTQDATKLGTLKNAQAYMRTQVAAIDAAAKALMDSLQSTASSDGIYDTQTVHGTNPTVQGQWDDALQHAISTDTDLGLTLSLFGLVQ